MGSSKHAKDSPPLIKGYLPVRLHLPSGEETFFYVKEHQSSKIPVHSDDADDAAAAPPTRKQQQRRGGGGGPGGSSDTLFVVNAPVVPPVRSKALLQAIFGRYAEVERVTVIENPRTTSHHPLLSALEIDSEPTWTTQFAAPSGLPASPQQNDVTGKYAHVVFASPNDMKRALRAVTAVMTSSHGKNGLVALTLDANELLALQHEPDQDSTSIEQRDQHWTSKSRVLRVAGRYRQSQRHLVSERAALLETCNVVMREFEHAEDVERKTREEAANQPDEDGFVTVTYSTNHGATSAIAPASSSKRQLDEDANHRRKGAKRLRKKKGHGASELDDFYRFQTKQERKKTLQELRQGFEEDLAKIRKMKEERKCLPF